MYALTSKHRINLNQSFKQIFIHCMEEQALRIYQFNQKETTFNSVTDFNGMSTCVVLFLAVRQRNCILYTLIFIFVVLCFLSLFLHTFLLKSKTF